MLAMLLLVFYPIHLFFNSAVFGIDYRGDTYDMAIASEPFLHGGAAYWPGVNLDNIGRFGQYLDPAVQYTIYNLTHPGTIAVTEMRVQLTQRKHIDKDTCRELYFPGSGVHLYRNVVLVVDKPDG